MSFTSVKCCTSCRVVKWHDHVAGVMQTSIGAGTARTSSTGAVVAMILGIYFVYDIVRCGIFWCSSLADIQTSRYVSYGLPLLICATGLLAICIVSLVRRLASCAHQLLRRFHVSDRTWVY